MEITFLLPLARQTTDERQPKLRKKSTEKKKKFEPWNRFPYLHFCFVSKLVQFGMRSKTNEISICYIVWQKLCILMMCCVSSHCRLRWNLSARAREPKNTTPCIDNLIFYTALALVHFKTYTCCRQFHYSKRHCLILLEQTQLNKLRNGLFALLLNNAAENSLTLTVWEEHS